MHVDDNIMILAEKGKMAIIKCQEEIKDLRQPLVDMYFKPSCAALMNLLRQAIFKSHDLTKPAYWPASSRAVFRWGGADIRQSGLVT